MSNPNRSHLTSRGRKVVATGLVGVGAFTGIAGKQLVDRFQENSRQPACEIPVKHGENITNISERVAKADDGFYGNVRIVNSAGEDRGIIAPELLRDTDSIQYGHVDENVCRQIGGTVLGPEQDK